MSRRRWAALVVRVLPYFGSLGMMAPTGYPPRSGETGGPAATDATDADIWQTDGEIFIRRNDPR